MDRKFIFRTFLAVIFITCICCMSAAARPSVTGIAYKSGGKVEVEFSGKVQYRNVCIRVTDSKGKRICTRITRKDSNELEFRLKGYKKGKTYRFTVCGISSRGKQTFGCVKGIFRLPKMKGSIPIRELGYDKKDRVVEFEFSKQVEWKDPVVKITSGKKNYVVRIKETDTDDLEVTVKKLKKGKVYKYSISGIRLKGDTEYTTLTGTFME